MRLVEFAPSNGHGGGEEDTLHKYARMWYNGDDTTQQQVEKVLARMGWEIGEIESEEGGAFVVKSGDENGNSYIGFAVSDLTESQIDEIDRRGFLKGLGMAAVGAAGLGAAGAAQARATPEWMAKVERAKALMAKGQSREQTARIMGIKGPNPGGSGPMSGDWGAVNYAAQEMRIKEGVAEGSQRVDSLVTDALKLMQGPELKDAVQALKTVLGDRELSSRRGFYNSYIRQMLDMYGQRGVAEGSLNESDSPVASAITRRILLQRSDLLQKYGPKKVTAAIDDVADFVGDVEEIGSSDVSGWVKQVEQTLASMGSEVEEAGPYGSRNPDTMSSSNYDRYQQDQMDQGKRAFKRAEMQHELGHEDDPNFERNLRQQQIDKDRGPWYIRIDGRIYKQKGIAKSFDWKKGANNYALAMVKNNPALQGKVMLSKSAEDK